MSMTGALLPPGPIYVTIPRRYSHYSRSSKNVKAMCVFPLSMSMAMAMRTITAMTTGISMRTTTAMTTGMSMRTITVMTTGMSMAIARVTAGNRDVESFHFNTVTASGSSLGSLLPPSLPLHRLASVYGARTKPRSDKSLCDGRRSSEQWRLSVPHGKETRWQSDTREAEGSPLLGVICHRCRRLVVFGSAPWCLLPSSESETQIMICTLCHMYG